MTEFRFADIHLFNLTWAVVAAVALLLVLDARGNRALDRFLSSVMQRRLVRQIPWGRRWTSVLLLGCCALALVFALMRPQWGRTVQSMTRVDSQIMVCLDVSKSMLAEDVVPNRLERAKAELDALLGMLDDGQQVGLTAFAGKATVLCPMTTDFSFLRLILAEATPQTVGRGGTKIGDAIRKCTDGFRETGDVNRLILLITDGEDHDSFPLDAAKAAKEKGIRIVTIGFGDEAGSKIEITDPQSGGRSFLKDRGGSDVISRLDGQTLRDIALETEGAYIPAATGALELQSIYDNYIQSLLNGSPTEQQRTIRNEAYQWCVLVGIFMMLASLLVRGKATKSSNLKVGVPLSCLLLVLSMSSEVFAQPPRGEQESSASADSKGQATLAPSPDTANGGDAKAQSEIGDAPERSASGTSMEDEAADPRELYNRALQSIASQPDEAEQLLNSARSVAGVDGELRYRALFNLGWVEITRADTALEDSQEQALEHLRLAASRFREAIRVRPDSQDARHNLEVVSRRIMALEDAIAQEDPKDLAAQLDELITRQREHFVELQNATLLAPRTDVNSAQTRSMFRGLGVTQRQLISDFQHFASQARQKADAQPAQGSQTTTQPTYQPVQIENMLGYLETSVQWMSKSRSFTRRLQASRGFVRWSAGLSAAKRARDQLRNPVEILGVLIPDSMELQSYTREFQRLNHPPLRPADDARPQWLNQEFLVDSQRSIAERVGELQEMLFAFSQQPASQEDASAEHFIESIKAALPALGRASTAFRNAREDLEGNLLNSADQNQQLGIEALQAAAENFYDLRRLIELMYQSEVNVQALVNSLATTADPQTISEVLELHGDNAARLPRLESLLEADLARAADASSGAQSDDESQPNGEQERAQLAAQLAQQLKAQMQGLRPQLADLPELFAAYELRARTAERPPSPDTTFLPVDIRLEQSQLPSESLAEAVSTLEELRRLYFTLIDHLRDTAQRQAELNDNTIEQLANTASPQTESPLLARQQELQYLSEQIADAFQNQANSASQPTDGEDPGTSSNGAPSNVQSSPSDAEARVEKLQTAATLVGEGSQAMNSASKHLSNRAKLADPPPEDADVDGHADVEAVADVAQKVADDQRLALSKLVEALRLFDESDDDENNDDQQQEQQQQQQQQANPDQQQSQQNMNAEQLLQAIREREAERRRSKEIQAIMADGTVEKDW